MVVVVVVVCGGGGGGGGGHRMPRPIEKDIKKNHVKIIENIQIILEII